MSASPAQSRIVVAPAHLGFRRLDLPRWTFVAWATYCRLVEAGRRPPLPRPIEDEIEARRLALMRRDLVPQDEPLAA